jgi:hypothetical protein
MQAIQGLEESGQFAEGLLAKGQENNLFLRQQLHYYDVFD